MHTLLLALWFLPSAEAKKPAPPPPPAWKCGDAVDADYRKGFAALSASRNEEAGTAFAAVLAKEPQCGLALLGQGRALLGAGKAADAVAPLATASTLYADKPEVFVWLARAEQASGDDDGALAAAKSAIALKPNSVEAQRVAQDVLLRRKDLPAARASLDAARATSNVVTWLCLEGWYAVAEGDLLKAKAMLAECEGVPDRTVYDELAARIAAASGSNGAASPAPTPAPSTPAAPTAGAPAPK